MRVVDAGEKIGGARKDLWVARGLHMGDIKSMNGAEVVQHLVKTAVWPRPDYAALIAGGMDAVTARLVKDGYDAIATKPSDYDESSVTSFVTALTLLRGSVEGVVSVADLGDANKRYIDALEESGVCVTWASRHNLVRAYTHWRNEGLSVHGPFDTSARALSNAKSDVAAGWPTAKKVRATARPKSPVPKRPHLDEVVRIGPEYRGERVDGQSFVELGFRGVEFGNWVADDERQHVVDLAYDGLLDLASVLCIAPEALPLGGTLALAFGARGVGRFAAHYEPARTVINMTKLSGAGSLAHEFGHALDHYLGEVSTASPYSGAPKSVSGWKKQARYTPDAHRLANLPEAVSRAADAVMAAIYTRPLSADEAIAAAEAQIAQMDQYLNGYLTRTQKKRVISWRERNEKLLAEAQSGSMSERTTMSRLFTQSTSIGKYWQEPTELFARSFECWVYDKLAERGQRSDYLVHGVEEGRYAEGYRGNPYPTGEERKRINAAFDTLFMSLRQHRGLAS
jgi:hypothetical protein